MLIFKLYILTWVIAVCGYTYSNILTDNEMILSKWRLFLYKKFSSCDRTAEDHWLFKIIVGCAYCVSGQWMLWTYLFISIFDSNLFDKMEYNLFIHLAVIMVTVFNVAIINKAGIYEGE